MGGWGKQASLEQEGVKSDLKKDFSTIGCSLRMSQSQGCRKEGWELGTGWYRKLEGFLEEVALSSA